MKQVYQLALAAAVPLAAHAAPLPLYQGAEVVVTATRQPQPAGGAISDVTVISRAQIEQAAGLDLPQLLARQPGVLVSSNGGRGTTASVSLRGANPNQTLVLIDGVRVLSATAGTTALEHIALDNVERIEILKGPASSLYGADAIGGVIQIFTRQGGDTPRYRARLGIGERNTRDAAASAAGRVGDTRYAFGISQSDSDGFSAQNAHADSAFGKHNDDADGYHNSSANLNLAHTLAAGHVLSLKLLETRARTEFDQSAQAQDQAKQRLSAQALTLDQDLAANWQSQLRFARSVDSSDAFAGGAASPSSQFRTTQLEWQWQNTFPTRLGGLVAGLNHTRQEVDGSVAFSQNLRTVKAAFAGYQGDFGAHSLQASVRRDLNSQFGGASTGQAGYGYRFAAGWQASLAAGSAFKAPTFNDLYWPLSFGYQGNPNLKPERSRSYEANLKWQRQDAEAKLTAFHQRIDHLISIAPDFSTVDNLNRAVIDGATLEGQRTLGGWQWNGSVTWQNARDADSHLQLPRRARLFGNAGLSKTYGRWTVGNGRKVVGRRYNDSANRRALAGYVVDNLLASYALNRELKLTGRLNNVTDRVYETVYGYNTPRRNVYLGVSYVSQ